MEVFTGVRPDIRQRQRQVRICFEEDEVVFVAGGSQAGGICEAIGYKD